VSESETFTPEAFIRAAPWQEAARPYADAQHEYSIRDRGDVDPEWHDRMIEFIAANGEPGEFEGRRYVYLDVDGYTLWASRGIYQPHPIVNRRRSDG
jgi:hypothetical protein